MLGFALLRGFWIRLPCSPPCIVVYCLLARCIALQCIVLWSPITYCCAGSCRGLSSRVTFAQNLGLGTFKSMLKAC